MTLTVQDSTGTVVGANSYINIAYADSYFTERGKADSEWVDLDDEEKEAALIAATSFIDNTNIGKFKGVRLLQDQTTQFPRSRLFDADGYLVSGIPELLKMATAEYAIRASVETLLPDVAYDDSGIPLKSKKEKIGPLEESYVYQDGATISNEIKKIPEADFLIKQYLNSSNVSFLSRA